MTGMFNKFKNSYGAYLVLGIVFTAIHLILPIINDDIGYVVGIITADYIGVAADNFNYWDRVIPFLKWNYFNYQAQTLTHLISFTLLQFRTVWMVLDISFIIILAYVLNYLFVGKDNVKAKWFVCAMVLIYPFWDMGTSGYLITTVAYLWHLAFLFIAIIPLKKTFKNEPFSKWEYPIYVFSAIYAAGAMQSSGLILIIYAIGMFLIYRQRKAVPPLLILALSLIAIHAAVLALSPGMHTRASGGDGDILLQMSLISRAELAFSSAVYHFIFKPNIVFAAFYSVLFLTVMFKRDSTLINKIVVLIPGIIVLFCAYASGFARGAVTKYGIIVPAEFGGSPSLFPYFVLSLLIVACLAITYCVYCVFDDKKKSLTAIGILTLGLGSRMILMFTPASIWASSTRTYIYLFFALIVVTIMLFTQLQKTKFNYWKVFSIYMVFIVCGYLFVLFFYIANQTPDFKFVGAPSWLTWLIEKWGRYPKV